MKDYTKISIPRRFRSDTSFFPNFNKPIGIVTESDLKEAKEETAVKWLVLPDDTEPADFVNNKRNKIQFFTSTNADLYAEMKAGGYNVSVDPTVAVSANPEALKGRNIDKPIQYESILINGHKLNTGLLEVNKLLNPEKKWNRPDSIEYFSYQEQLLKKYSLMNSDFKDHLLTRDEFEMNMSFEPFKSRFSPDVTTQKPLNTTYENE